MWVLHMQQAAGSRLESGGLTGELLEYKIHRIITKQALVAAACPCLPCLLSSSWLVGSLARWLVGLLACSLLFAITRDDISATIATTSGRLRLQGAHVECVRAVARAFCCHY